MNTSENDDDNSLFSLSTRYIVINKCGLLQLGDFDPDNKLR